MYLARMDLSLALQDLGLSDKQARIYLALLQKGEGSAYEVATRSGLKKPTTYVLLQEMVERRLVKVVLNQKATHYVAVDPVELFVETRTKFQRAESALPELRALSNVEAKTVRAEYFEGLSGVRDMYSGALKDKNAKEQIGFYAHGRDTVPELMQYWSELNADLVKRSIHRRGITTKDATTKEYIEYTAVPKELLDLKALSPKLYDSNISIEVFGSSTYILSHQYLQGIVIQNPDIANVLKQIFELVWKYVPEAIAKT